MIQSQRKSDLLIIINDQKEFLSHLLNAQTKGLRIKLDDYIDSRVLEIGLSATVSTDKQDYTVQYPVVRNMTTILCNCEDDWIDTLNAYMIKDTPIWIKTTIDRSVAVAPLQGKIVKSKHTTPLQGKNIYNSLWSAMQIEFLV